MIFHLCSYSDFFFHLAFLIIGSHIVFNSILGLLSRSSKPNICADSSRRLILQCSALSIISTSSHKERWFPFSFHIWSAIPDFSISPRTIAFVKVPEFDKHLKKAGGHINRNVVEITIKMKAIVQKPLMIKINLLRLRNLDNKRLKKAGGHIGRNVVEITIKMKTIVRKPFMIKINKLRLRNLDNWILKYQVAFNNPFSVYQLLCG